MTLVVVPPLSDPTTQHVTRPGERLLDLGRRFADRAGEPTRLLALAASLDRPSAPDAAPDTAVDTALDTAQRCLLARAAADALVHPVPGTTRLRATAAAIRVLSSTDAGLSAGLDDVELRTGSTQSSGHVLLAAVRCTLFDPELDGLGLAGSGLAGLGPTGPDQAAGATSVEIVVDTDQQLPAAFRLVTRLAAAHHGEEHDPRTAPDVVLTGRFVARHAEALRRVGALVRVRVAERVRARTVRPEYLPVGAPPLVWVTDPAEVPAPGAWAGWLTAAQVLRLPPAAWDTCHGLVVVASGPTDGARPGAARAGLAELLPRLAGRVPVALEVLTDPLRAPAAPAARAAGARTGGGGPLRDDAWWLPWGPRVRVAGVRAYRPPALAGRGAPGDDLARWAADGSVDEVADAPGRVEPVDLLPQPPPLLPDPFPGRVAGALFTPERSAQLVDGYAVDPSVRAVRSEYLSPDGGPPGDFLVCLRTGRVARVAPTFARLVAELTRHGAPVLAAVMRRGRDGDLLTGLCRAGAVRREVAA